MRREIVFAAVLLAWATPAQAWVGPEVTGPYRTSWRAADVAGDGTTASAWTRRATWADHTGFYPDVNLSVDGGPDAVSCCWSSDIGLIVAAARGGRGLTASGSAVAVARTDGSLERYAVDGTVVSADMNDRGEAAAVTSRYSTAFPPEVSYTLHTWSPDGTPGGTQTLPGDEYPLRLWVLPDGAAAIESYVPGQASLIVRNADGSIAAPWPLDVTESTGVTVAGDDAGHVLAGWKTATGGAVALRGADGQWGPVTALPGPPSVTANPRGDALVAWEDGGAAHVMSGNLRTGMVSAPQTLGDHLRQPTVAIGADGSAVLAARRGAALVAARREGLGAFGTPAVASCGPTAEQALAVADDGTAYLFDGLGIVHDTPGDAARTCRPQRPPAYAPDPAPGTPFRVDVRPAADPGSRIVAAEFHFGGLGSTTPTGTPGVVTHRYSSAGAFSWRVLVTEQRVYGTPLTYTRELRYETQVTASATLTAARVQRRRTVQRHGVTVRAGAAASDVAQPVTLTARAGRRVLARRRLLLGPDPAPVTLDVGRPAPEQITVTLRQGAVRRHVAIRVR